MSVSSSFMYFLIGSVRSFALFSALSKPSISFPRSFAIRSSSLRCFSSSFVFSLSICMLRTRSSKLSSRARAISFCLSICCTAIATCSDIPPFTSSSTRLWLVNWSCCFLSKSLRFCSMFVRMSEAVENLFKLAICCSISSPSSFACVIKSSIFNCSSAASVTPDVSMPPIAPVGSAARCNSGA